MEAEFCMESPDERSEQQYFYYLKGQRIALVGGGPHYDHDVINSYDVVVRCNLHRLDQQGGRCDVLYTRTAVPGHHDLRAIDDYCPKWLVLERRKRRVAGLVMSNNQKLYKTVFTPYGGKAQAEKDQIQPMTRESQVAHPLIGMVAVNHLLQSEVKEVYITGMDFYRRTPVADRSPNYQCHEPDKQLRWLKLKIALDARISPDPTLLDIMIEDDTTPLL
jgi:hypothetical protein